MSTLTRKYLSLVISSTDLRSWLGAVMKFVLRNMRFRPLPGEHKEDIRRILKTITTYWRQNARIPHVMMFSLGMDKEGIVYLIGTIVKKKRTVSLWSYIIDEYEDITQAIETLNDEEYLKDILTQQIEHLSKFNIDKIPASHSYLMKKSL